MYKIKYKKKKSIFFITVYYYVRYTNFFFIIIRICHFIYDIIRYISVMSTLYIYIYSVYNKQKSVFHKNINILLYVVFFFFFTLMYHQLYCAMVAAAHSYTFVSQTCYINRLTTGENTLLHILKTINRVKI